jgi:hypothetical protein
LSPAARKNVEFKTRDGITLRGWFYTGAGNEAKKPAIVMAHGFSAVKEMMLANFAEEFAKIGVSCGFQSRKKAPGIHSYLHVLGSF